MMITVWKRCAGACQLEYADWCICQTHGLCPMCHRDHDEATETNEQANQ